MRHVTELRACEGESSYGARAREAALAEGALAQEEDRLAEVLVALVTRRHALLAQAQETATQCVGCEEAARLAEESRGLCARALRVDEELERALAARLSAITAREQAHEHVRAMTEQLAGELDTASRTIEAATAALEARARQDDLASARGEPLAEAAADLPIAELDAFIDVDTESNFYSGLGPVDAVEGVFVATLDVLPLGTPVRVRVGLPDNPQLHLCGRVRWIREYNDDTPDIEPGVAIEVNDADANTAAIIRSFVARREPVLFA